MQQPHPFILAVSNGRCTLKDSWRGPAQASQQARAHANNPQRFVPAGTPSAAIAQVGHPPAAREAAARAPGPFGAPFPAVAPPGVLPFLTLQDSPA
jgi:hypothetical protein